MNKDDIEDRRGWFGGLNKSNEPEFVSDGSCRDGCLIGLSLFLCPKKVECLIINIVVNRDAYHRGLIAMNSALCRMMLSSAVVQVIDS